MWQIEDQEKCTKIYNACAKRLLCSSNVLFRGILVAVAVVVAYVPEGLAGDGL